MPKTEQAHFRFGFFVACPLAPEPLIGAAFAIGLAAGLFWPTLAIFVVFFLTSVLDRFTGALSFLSLLPDATLASAFFLSVAGAVVRDLLG